MSHVHPLYHTVRHCDTFDELQARAAEHGLRCVEVSWTHTPEGRTLSTAVFAEMHSDKITHRFDYR